MKQNGFPSVESISIKVHLSMTAFLRAAAFVLKWLMGMWFPQQALVWSRIFGESEWVFSFWAWNEPRSLLQLWHKGREALSDIVLGAEPGRKWVGVYSRPQPPHSMWICEPHWRAQKGGYRKRNYKRHLAHTDTENLRLSCRKMATHRGKWLEGFFWYSWFTS